MDKDTLKGNISIGEFLGMQFIDYESQAYPNGYYINPDEEEGITDLPYQPEDWIFHICIEWLYPVYRKCIAVADEMDNEDLYIKLDIIQDALLDAEPAEVLFDRIVEFINLYNDIKDGNR